jgi:hypothetical protein
LAESNFGHETTRTSSETSEVAMTALTHLREDGIREGIAGFAEEFQFKDRGIGLEFNHPRRLAELFEKSRELYPGSSLQTTTSL